RVSGAYGETILVPVLVRPLQKGDAVHESDFQLERRERESATDDVVIDVKLLMGRVARNAMRPGIVLRDRDLVKPIVVERNAIINMQLDTPGIHVTMKGKAMEQGSIGELISVQNINSKRIVQGIVVGSNQVRIGTTAAAVARTASASH
ncbi:MAG: flagellar basal body P-ring formation chaperone FlgA, partial [Beijerinckiaceae bacterium]